MQDRLTTSEQIVTMRDTVHYLLQHNRELRDNDNALCVAVWRREMFNLTGSFNEQNFFERYEQGSFTSSDTITRLSRYLKKEHPELRGIDKSEEEKKVKLIFRNSLFD